MSSKVPSCKDLFLVKTQVEIPGERQHLLGYERSISPKMCWLCYIKHNYLGAMDIRFDAFLMAALTHSRHTIIRGRRDSTLTCAEIGGNLTLL